MLGSPARRGGLQGSGKGELAALPFRLARNGRLQFPNHEGSCLSGNQNRWTVSPVAVRASCMGCSFVTIVVVWAGCKLSAIVPDFLEQSGTIAESLRSIS